MPRLPDPKVRLLFGAPLSAMALALARAPDPAEPGMASAVPRILAAGFACVAVAYVASAADADRRGPWNFVGGLAMDAAAAIAMAFGASLCVAAAFAGGIDVLAIAAVGFVGALMGVSLLILAYVVSAITEVKMKTAAAILAVQVPPLAFLVFHAGIAAACAVAAIAAAIACHAVVSLRARNKTTGPT